MAQEADFSEEELESLKQELHHYEKRLEKLHHLKAEVNLVGEKEYEQNNDSTFGGHNKNRMGRKLSKHADSVDKLHAELSSKIAARHSEL